MEERRNAPNRIKADVQVDYLGTHVVLYHRVLNLSIGGICIESPSVEAVGKVVRLSLNFPDLHRSIDVEGEVVWANQEPPQDMGIRFRELSDADKETIRAYVQLEGKKGGGSHGKP